MEDKQHKICHLIEKKFWAGFSGELASVEECWSTKLTRDQAWGTYAIRERIQNEKQGERSLAGYAELLQNLKLFDESHLLLHSFREANELVFVFTDIEIKILIGVLSTSPIPPPIR